jgi:hypothetical protein
MDNLNRHNCNPAFRELVARGGALSVSSTTSTGNRMKLYFDDEGFDGQLQRTVGKCDAGMANVGECLYIASRIAPGDRDSWYAAWSTFADGLVAQATTAEQAGHATSARFLVMDPPSFG